MCEYLLAAVAIPQPFSPDKDVFLFPSLHWFLRPRIEITSFLLWFQSHAFRCPLAPGAKFLVSKNNAAKAVPRLDRIEALPAPGQNRNPKTRFFVLSATLFLSFLGSYPHLVLWHPRCFQVVPTPRGLEQRGPSL
jgi:hypothetical protein